MRVVDEKFSRWVSFPGFSLPGDRMLGAYRLSRHFDVAWGVDVDPEAMERATCLEEWRAVLMMELARSLAVAQAEAEAGPGASLADIGRMVGLMPWDVMPWHRVEVCGTPISWQVGVEMVTVVISRWVRSRRYDHAPVLVMGLSVEEPVVRFYPPGSGVGASAWEIRLGAEAVAAWYLPATADCLTRERAIEAVIPLFDPDLETEIPVL